MEEVPRHKHLDGLDNARQPPHPGPTDYHSESLGILDGPLLGSGPSQNRSGKCSDPYFHIIGKAPSVVFGERVWWSFSSRLNAALS